MALAAAALSLTLLWSACSGGPEARVDVPKRTSLIALLSPYPDWGLVEVTGFCEWDAADGFSGLYVREEDADLRLRKNGFRLVLDDVVALGTEESGMDLLIMVLDDSENAHWACECGYYTVTGDAGPLDDPDDLWSGRITAFRISHHP